jgi:hypothetical protein
MHPNWDVWYENIPSGNPDSDSWHVTRFFRSCLRHFLSRLCHMDLKNLPEAKIKATNLQGRSQDSVPKDIDFKYARGPLP